MIFHYNYQINIKRLINFIDYKKLNILDFGCGKGLWPNKIVTTKKIDKIILYDNELNLFPLLKQKYRDKKFQVNFNLNKIVKKKEYNVIIFSSVIQYISHSNFNKLLEKLTKNKKALIVISDIPFLPKFIEFLLLPFFNIKRFFFVLTLIFSKKYKNMNYYTYAKKDFDYLKKKYKIKLISNLHDLNKLRYALVLKPKNN
tara:strand:+ start:124 stop:723 length:600 start_codon:yes stop_codon:yes gene_type:complete